MTNYTRWIEAVPVNETECFFRWKGTVQSKIVFVVVPLAVTRGSYSGVCEGSRTCPATPGTKMVSISPEKRA